MRREEIVEELRFVATGDELAARLEEADARVFRKEAPARVVAWSIRAYARRT